MGAQCDLDESKLSAWLEELGLQCSPPKQLRSAKLGPLWSFLGLEKIKNDDFNEEKHKPSIQEASLFPSNPASQGLQDTKVRPICQLGF